MNFFDPNWYVKKIERANGFFQIKIEDFDELIELIRPDKIVRIKSVFTKSYEESVELGMPLNLTFNKFLYRGVSNTTHELLPAFFRHQKNKNLSHKDQILEEFNLLKKFVESCDYAGAQVPNDSYKLRGIFKNERNFIQEYFSKNPGQLAEELYELAGFAQHYGVPTRLLDWSSHPLVSLYFASIGAIKCSLESDDCNWFSLWIYSPISNSNNSTQQILDEKIKIVEVPKAINQHISFQQGCFIMVEQENNDTNLMRMFDSSEEEIKEDIEEEIKEDIDEVVEDGPKFKKLNDLLEQFNLSSNLLKIDIPIKLAYDIYEYCNIYNFNSATLFRGPHGASQYVLDSIEIEKFKKLNDL